MSDTAVAVTELTANELSVRLDGTTPGAAMTSVSTGNVAVISMNGSGRNALIVVSGDGTHTATLAVSAGDEPPSERAGIGGLSALSVAATGTYVLPLSAGQFFQDDGTVRIPVSGTGPVYIGCVRLPISQ